jgi:hypothetical protein
VAEELEFPVAYCPTCEDKGPVVIDEINDDDIGELVVIYCPQCSSILNFDGDIRVEWYTAEQVAEVTGWRVVDGS